MGNAPTFLVGVYSVQSWSLIHLNRFVAPAIPPPRTTCFGPLSPGQHGVLNRAIHLDSVWARRQTRTNRIPGPRRALLDGDVTGDAAW